jgi:cell division transport system permease protein
VTLGYTIREGLAGFRRAKFAVLTATSAMAVALVLIGVFAAVAYEANQVTSWLKQRVGELEIFIEDVEEPIARGIFERARLVPGVSEAEYITRQEAQAIFREEFGEGADLFMDEPFLPASVKIRVESDYANPDSLVSLGEQFKTWNRVDEVVFNQDLLARVQQNLRLLTLIGLALGGIVVLASLFLVANTIRLTIYARRLLIRTMKLVGATDKFIRQPFIIEGVAQGLLAGIVAAAALWGLYFMAVSYVPQITPAGILPAFILGIGLVGTGALLGWGGSMIAVRRFIRNIPLH